MEQVVLYTNHSAFNSAVKDYAKRTQVEQNVKLEMKRLLPNYKVTKEFYMDIELNFFNQLEKQYPKYKELHRHT